MSTLSCELGEDSKIAKVSLVEVSLAVERVECLPDKLAITRPWAQWLPARKSGVCR